MKRHELFQKDLWTKDFTTLLLGSFISLAGQSAMLIVFGLIILDLTQSGLFYAILLSISDIAGILVPITIGSYLEKWPKQKVIYLLDFASSALFFGLAIMAYFELLSVTTLILNSFILDVISVVYLTDYSAYFPAVVSKENYSKAFSLDSLMSNIAESASIIGLLAYEYIGIVPVLFFSGACYFVAACFETRLSPHQSETLDAKSTSISAIINDYREVWNSIKKVQGLVSALVVYLADSFRTGAMWALILPYFEYYYPEITILSYRVPSEYLYVVFLGFYTVGQFWSGVFGYAGNESKKSKTFSIYLLVSFGEMLTLAIFPFCSAIGTVVLMAIAGFCSVTSFCIYESAFYSYIPENMRARFSGFMGSTSSLMLICGNLLGGLIIDYSQRPEYGFLLTSLPQIIFILAFSFFGLSKFKLFFNGSMTSSRDQR